MHRLKEEGKKYAEERTRRVQEYNRQCLINKIEKEKQKMEKMMTDVELIKQKRSEEHKRLSHEKKKLQDSMNEFMRTGVWKKPEGVDIGAFARRHSPPSSAAIVVAFLPSPPSPNQAPTRCWGLLTKS